MGRGMTVADRDEFRSRAIQRATSPEEATALSWIYDEIDRINASYLTMRPRVLPHMIPAGMTEADRLCRVCRGFGTLYDHYSDGFTSACRCHVCDGHGYL